MLYGVVNRRVDFGFGNVLHAPGESVEVIQVCAEQAGAFRAGWSVLEDSRRPYRETLLIVQRPSQKALDGQPLATPMPLRKLIPAFAAVDSVSST